MNYEKIYSLLIESRKNRKLDPNEYYEKHHIWPRSLEGPNKNWNLVYLTAREHYIAHLLLYKITLNEDKRKMGYALWCMCWKNNSQRKITSRKYEIIRKIFNEANTGKKNKKVSDETKQKMSEAKTGKKVSDETKQKMSEAKTGTKLPDEQRQKLSEFNTGKKLSDEQKQKMSEAATGTKPSEETKQKMSEAKTGKKLSDEAKQKISETNTGMPHSNRAKQKMSEAKTGKTGKNAKRVVCEHCGKDIAINVYYRCHGDKCKYKSKI